MYYKAIKRDSPVNERAHGVVRLDHPFLEDRTKMGHSFFHTATSKDHRILVDNVVASMGILLHGNKINNSYLFLLSILIGLQLETGNHGKNRICERKMRLNIAVIGS